MMADGEDAPLAVVAVGFGLPEELPPEREDSGGPVRAGRRCAEEHVHRAGVMWGAPRARPWSTRMIWSSVES